MAIMGEVLAENKKARPSAALLNVEWKVAACQGATAGRTPRVKSNETVVRGVITRCAFLILE
jgi:hypothetical protein